ncbi:hypothetical protein [Caldicellulosiruptor naganoensis]|uniref:Uncharacterized protein n=1 Tax=Caldicellulosiruptor naganoensis TaxID=29324 RepID=A0ABY7BGV3_9FIRM|nr:hypothetical protein [Caldicellulosiruptor naganoensis]WAM30579.1 hypothetical protein OTJ99_001341 [Caldicellulosiruptor naganoensis]
MIRNRLFDEFFNTMIKNELSRFFVKIAIFFFILVAAYHIGRIIGRLIYDIFKSII